MTRQELLEALLVERFGPRPTRKQQPRPTPTQQPVDDELTIRRRSRDLDHELAAFDNYVTHREVS